MSGNGAVDASSISSGNDFSGGGYCSEGMRQVPYVGEIWAANHWPPAVATHEANFPAARHYLGDIRALDVETRPRVDHHWSSPACPPWTDARGLKRDFDKQTTQQLSLFEPPEPDVKAVKARALMEEVPRYLRAMASRGRPVLTGVVENVIQCRLWADWDRWLNELHTLGYRTQVIALNSMHAVAPSSLRVPQSRNRLYVAYWHRSLGRDPDWDKWLRPQAWCPRCAEVVRAVQVFKRPGADMGAYRAQYLYLCPKTTCRGIAVEPPTLPALVAIDPALTATPIGERPEGAALARATVERIRAGIRQHWLTPALTPAGGTWRTTPTPLDQPAPTRTTVETDAVTVPPLLVPVEGRPGKTASTAVEAHRTQTCRNETGVLVPFVTPMRGGGDALRSRPVSGPVHTVTASGNHHGLVQPTNDLSEQAQRLLVPYYGTADTAHPADRPCGTIPTRDRYGLAQPADRIDPGDLDAIIAATGFRMLATHEIKRIMGIPQDYLTVASSKRDTVRLYGNGVTPATAEIITYALVEAITGESFDPATLPAEYWRAP